MSGTTTGGWPYVTDADEPRLYPPVSKGLADKLEERVQRIDFPSPLAVWVIDIGMPAQVVVYDSSGRVVEPGTITQAGTRLTLTFSAPFSGVAHVFG
jgi:hypothetical protein